MIAGISGFNATFLADLNQTESHISQVNEQISSGYRVNQASDDPSAVAPILGYLSDLSQIKQVQSNLSSSQVEAQTADGALQTASTLLDQLVSLGSNGASSTASSDTRATLGQQVQQIEQELVSTANTSIGGVYIFGGDNSSAAPYTFDWTSSGGVVQNTSAANTTTLRDADGNEIVPRLTAEQIFDVRDSSGNPTTGNIFQAAYALGNALLTNDQSGIQTALAAVKAGVTQLGQATTSYGNIESWIQQASSAATTHLNNLTTALSGVRDADIAADSTQLTLDQTALQAALAAHGSLDIKSLFSYLG